MSTVSKLVWAVLLVVLLGCSKVSAPAQNPASASTQRSYVDPRVQVEVVVHHDDERASVFFAEVARTPSERARGLMFRQALATDHAMLFLFQEERRHSFYMKNTLVPLDIVFLDSTGSSAKVVGVLEHMQPGDETSRSIATPSRAALEIRAGLVRKLGIQNGGRVEIRALRSRNGS